MTPPFMPEVAATKTNQLRVEPDSDEEDPEEWPEGPRRRSNWLSREPIRGLPGAP